MIPHAIAQWYQGGILSAMIVSSELHALTTRIFKRAHPTSLNAHFNIIKCSAPFKWRKLHDRRRHLYYQPEAKRELETLERLLGIEVTTSD